MRKDVLWVHAVNFGFVFKTETSPSSQGRISPASVVLANFPQELFFDRDEWPV